MISPFAAATIPGWRCRTRSRAGRTDQPLTSIIGGVPTPRPTACLFTFVFGLRVIPHLSFICTDHLTTRSKLETPPQQVMAYLKDHGIPASKQPQVSLLFAESMLSELQGAVEQWQVMLESMRQANDEIRRAVTQSN